MFAVSMSPLVIPRLSHPHISLQLLPFTFGSVRKE